MGRAMGKTILDFGLPILDLILKGYFT